MRVYLELNLCTIVSTVLNFLNVVILFIYINAFELLYRLILPTYIPKSIYRCLHLYPESKALALQELTITAECHFSSVYIYIHKMQELFFFPIRLILFYPFIHFPVFFSFSFFFLLPFLPTHLPRSLFLFFLYPVYVYTLRSSE